ncbi:MAG: prepilin peptidase [Micavibrio sp.]
MQGLENLTGVAGLILAIPFGLCLGSFATAIASRIPLGKSWIFSKDKGAERSACVHCHHGLGVLDLIPLFSWLFLRGRCRYCQVRIGVRYPLTECAALLMTLMAYYSWGFSGQGLLVILAIPFLLAMLMIDWEHMILPDQLQIIVLVLGGLFWGAGVGEYFSLSDLLGQIMVMALYAGPIFLMGWMISRLKKVEALGFGDVKFMAIAGLWLGISALPLFFVLTGVMGIVFSIFWKFRTGVQRFPFGPALITSFFIVLCLQGPLLKMFFNASLGL